MKTIRVGDKVRIGNDTCIVVKTEWKRDLKGRAVTHYEVTAVLEYSYIERMRKAEKVNMLEALGLK